MWKIWWNQTGNKWGYGTCAPNAGYLRVQTHAQNKKCLLLFNSNSGYTNVPQCYVRIYLASLV